jgi:hypothetical protein
MPVIAEGPKPVIVNHEAHGQPFCAPQPSGSSITTNWITATTYEKRYAMTDLKSNTGLNKNAPVLLRSDSKAVIHAPVDKIDIPEWLFTLTDEE